MSRYLAPTLAAILVATAAVHAADDATAIAAPPRVSKVDKGKRIEQDLVLATSLNSYTLRYDQIELPDDPAKIDHQKWAPTKGYTPLGIVSPSMACWYNQGFFIWTFDGFNIKDHKATIRVVRECGPDAMVEIAWDTPKVKAVARFAVTSQSDKLLFFGRWEPKADIKNVKLRLMAFPVTFKKPWVRALTTAQRTLANGSAEIDLAAERWLLLEDTLPDRTGAGSAGLLLGDASAFSKVTVNGIGGYAEYVDITLDPDRREFALGLYEYPAMPDYKQTRAYFRRAADTESNALARLLKADLDKPLTPLPVDQQRLARAEKADADALKRPAEIWRPNPKPLAFPWAAKIPGPPVKVAVLAARWAAYDTMELARRLEMDVRHQYFDRKTTITSPRSWPYRGQTGIGPLNTSLAQRNAVRTCSDASREVILIGDLEARAIGPRLRSTILTRVKKGTGLVLSGNKPLAGWPKQLTAAPDPTLAEPALSAIPWRHLPGVKDAKTPPLRGYRFGEGRVIVFRADIGRYLSLLPLNHRTEGVDGIDDRLLALHAQAFLAAAGRKLPARVTIAEPDAPTQAGEPTRLPVKITGKWSSVLVRVQDDLDTVLACGDDLLDAQTKTLRVPPLPAMRRHVVDVVARNDRGECVGFATTVIDPKPAHTIGDVALSPSKRTHPKAAPSVELIDGGKLVCQTTVTPSADGLTLHWEVHDCHGRLLARARSPVATDGTSRAELALSRPVTVAHTLDVTLRSGDAPLAVKRVPFAVPLPFAYDDFTILMWSYAGGDLTIRRENRRCYELGSDMMDLCHMGGYSDQGAAREYALAARSGQRIVPYVTRIAGSEREDHTLVPGLFNQAWIKNQQRSITTSCRQAAPYAPPAYTLGDENYLSRGRHEVEVSPESIAAFRGWLTRRYGTIDALNAAWHTNHTAFDAIQRPMLLDQAVKQTETFAPWFDFRRFMDAAFADLHERLAGVIRQVHPAAKVGWDGLLRYHWQAGYDFSLLTRNLELNQVYTTHPLQGELVRSFARPDALTGEWGNNVADKEDGFSAIIWHNLFRGHNSCWWWTSWGCDYIPFNPDMSVSHMGRWFFDSAREVKAGPGNLLVRARRDDAGVAVLYSQNDLFAHKLATEIVGAEGWPSNLSWQRDLVGVMNALEDFGCQYRFLAAAEMERDPAALDDVRALVLPYATCLSDKHLRAIRAFVEKGGLLVADGRAAILTGNGGLRDTRPLDDLFGVKTAPGLAAFQQTPATPMVQVDGAGLKIPVLEPNLSVTTGRAARTAGDAPLFVSNTSGKGHAFLLNVPFATFHTLRRDDHQAMFLRPLSQALAKVGVQPYARLVTHNGPARSIEQTLFLDGPVKYLALQQDILRRDLPEQAISVTIDQPAHVYDVRAGTSLSDRPTTTWKTTIARGTPRLYALMPYRVTGLDVAAPKAARPGDTVNVGVTVRTGATTPRYHAVRLDVFTPGSDAPHRQYSLTSPCPDGQGAATVPLALNDPSGTWRLRLTDAATGTTTDRTVEVRAP